MKNIVDISHEHFKVAHLLKAAEAAYDSYAKHTMWHERGCAYMDLPMEDLRVAIDSLLNHINGNNHAPDSNA